MTFVPVTLLGMTGANGAAARFDKPYTAFVNMDHAVVLLDFEADEHEEFTERHSAVVHSDGSRIHVSETTAEVMRRARA